MNHNVVRELVKVSSGYVAGCVLLEFIHTLDVPVISFIQMLFYFFYYLSLCTLFDKIEISWHARREQTKNLL